MSAAQPFPVLASADNSRAGSPAPSSGSPGSQRGGRGKGNGKGKGGSKQAPRGKENGVAVGDKAAAEDKAAAGEKTSKPRHKKQRSKAKSSAAAAAAVEQQQGSETSGSSSAGNAGKGSKGRGKKRQDAGSKSAAAAAVNTASEATTPTSVAAATDDSGKRAKKAGKGSRRRTVANPQSTTPPPAQPSPTQPAAQPTLSHGSMPLARSSSSGALPLAMIVAGENGRARVLFNPQGVDNDHPLAHSGMSPRFSAGAVHSARSSAQNSRLASSYGDGLGLRSPMSPAQPVHAPGMLRQRSMTSTQHHQHQGEPQWHGHHHAWNGHHQQQQQWNGHQYPQQPWNGYQQQWHAPQDVPLTAPEVRGRSQSMHMSMTGLRISLAQSRPGNVLSPHIALPPRSANAPAGVQTNTYANNGYFATRRASLSNVGLAVDPSHSIRIPTIMFEKPKPEDLAKVSAQKPAASGAAAVEDGAAPQGAPPTPVSAEDGSAGEMLAMQRLQEMIASMRNISQPQSAKKQERVSSPVDAAAEPVDSAKSAVVQMPPTPAAHPTSRFDSILEEDEDGEDDEAILDQEEPKT
ncbi:hypothetical protein IW150_005973, partial [Coemansia sp. RSA 2607]